MPLIDTMLEYVIPGIVLPPGVVANRLGGGQIGGLSHHAPCNQQRCNRRNCVKDDGKRTR